MSSPPVRLKLTSALLAGIDFQQRVLGLDVQGQPMMEPTPEGVRDWIVRDEQVPGLAIRVYPGKQGKAAHISFIVSRKMSTRTDGSQGLKSATVRRVLGSYPQLNLQEARSRALKTLAMMVDGLDPAFQKAKAEREQAKAKQDLQLTFGKVYASFTEEDNSVKEATRKDRKKVIKWMTGSPLWTTPLFHVDVEVVGKSFRPLFDWADGKGAAPGWGSKKPDLASAWKCFSYCQTAYHHAMAAKAERSFMRGTSPFSVVAAQNNWNRPQPRERALATERASDQEWIKQLVALRDHPAPQVGVFADYLICLMVWGGRRRETQLLRWQDVDLEKQQGVFIKENTKSGTDHPFPLTPWIMEILQQRRVRNQAWDRDGEWVFPSRQHGKPIAEHRRALEELKAETGLWITAHDLRRTVAAETAGLSQSNGMLVSLTLNHSGGRAGITQRYLHGARVKLLRPMFLAREARLRALAGLESLEEEKGPIDRLIEFLEAAREDPAAAQEISKKADAMLVMFGT